MIVYLTRPDNHEVVMGGVRHIQVWATAPAYYHLPQRIPVENQSRYFKGNYRDWGWRDHGPSLPNTIPFKPLAKQNDLLRDNAWRLIYWSCIPRSAKIALEDTFTWADTLLPGEDPNDEFKRTNGCSLMSHMKGPREIEANIHHKRFLLEANLVTGDCRILTPNVHFPKRLVIQTLDIEEPYASRDAYFDPEADAESDEIPF